MSDWRKRAQPLDGSSPGGWKARALPANEASESAPTTGAGEAALEHFGNTATLGYLPHIQAGVEKLLPNPTGDVDEKLRAEGFSLPDADESYVTLRDQNLKRLEREAAEHPVASKLGTAGGIAASALLPMGAAAKGASLGAKAIQGAKAGAAMGALANPGDREGEVDPLQLGGRAKGAVVGGAIGAAAPAVLQGASSAGRRVSDHLKAKAAALAEKATGATGKGTDRFAAGTGRELLDRGIVKFGSSPEDIARNAQRAMDVAQSSKDQIINTRLAGTNVDRNHVYNHIRNKIQGLAGDESQVDLVRKLESKLDDLTEVSHKTGAQVPLGKSEEIRRGFDKAAKWDSASDAPTREANKLLANAYREIGEQTATAADPTLGARFKADKTTQRLLIPVAEAAEKRAAQLKQSPAGGLLDMAAAGAGATVGGPLGAIGGLAVKNIRPRLPAAGAVSADAAAKAVGRASGALKKLNPQVVQAIAQRTARGGEPTFERDLEPMLRDQRLMDIFKKDPSLIDAIDDERLKAKVRRAIASGGSK